MQIIAFPWFCPEPPREWITSGRRANDRYGEVPQRSEGSTTATAEETRSQSVGNSLLPVSRSCEMQLQEFGGLDGSASFKDEPCPAMNCLFGGRTRNTIRRINSSPTALWEPLHASSRGQTRLYEPRGTSPDIHQKSRESCLEIHENAR